MVCTSCGKPLSFIRRGLTVGDDLLCPDCFAEVPPPGEMARLASYYEGLASEELISLLEKGTRRHRVYALKAAKEELLSRGGSAADRARVIFSSLPNVEYLEPLIEKQLAAEAGNRSRREYESSESESATGPDTRSHVLFLTTESTVDVPIAERLEIVSAEVAIGMRGIRDFLVGTMGSAEAKSLAPLEDLQRAKRAVLDALRQKAREMGADAVVAVSMRYEQLGAGINMLLVVAMGTAVRLAPTGLQAPEDVDSAGTTHEIGIPVYRFDPSPVNEDSEKT